MNFARLFVAIKGAFLYLTTEIIHNSPLNEDSLKQKATILFDK
jgi:hypothetical protein